MLLEPFGGPGRRLPAQPGSSNKWVARGTISSRQIDDLEPALTRHGYDVRTRADRFNVKPIEIKVLLAGNPARRAYPRADRSHERRWGPRMKSCKHFPHVFHLCYARGTETGLGTYNYLDFVPKGRDEDGLAFTMSWVRHHDRYESGHLADPGLSHAVRRIPWSTCARQPV
jgi:Bacterial protein of unknown function (DUF899)